MTGALGSDAAGPVSSSSSRPWPSTESARPAGQATDHADRAPRPGAGVVAAPEPAAVNVVERRVDTPTPDKTLPPDDAEHSDAELLRAHVAGDRDAFATLFHRHRDRLWAVALRTLADREEAADALQDALLSAHRSAARFRGDAAVTTWLHRIVVNACLDRIRRRQAHPTVPLPDSTRPNDTTRWQGGVEPAAPATDHDTALVVRQALAELPVEQRAALVLVDLQGYSVAEVARILGVAEGTVKSRCARGRARLAVLLGHLRPAGTGQDSTARTGVPSVTTGNLGSGGRVRSGSTRLGADEQVGQDRSRGPHDQDQEES